MSYASQVIADGASYYWRLGDPSGTVAAAAVGGVPGTISGGVTLGVSGPLADGSKAMTFNGTTGKVVTAAPVALLTPFTLEGWMKTTTANEQPLWSTRNGPADSGQFVLLMTAAGGLYVYAQIAGGTGSTVTALKDGLWHHVVLVCDGTAAGLCYVDGVNKPVTPFGSAYGSGTSTHALELGADSASPTFFPGSLAEVAVYPFSLTPAQITNHYALRTAVATSVVVLPMECLMRGYTHGFAITPHDTNTLSKPVQAVWVGGAGDIAVVLANENTVLTLKGVPTGILEIVPKLIKVATTATQLVGLSE